IVIGVIYFLSKMLKKPEEAGGSPAEEGTTGKRRAGENPTRRSPVGRSPVGESPTGDSPTGDNPAERPMTFEELLREITEGKQAPKAQPRPQPRPQPVHTPQYEPYEVETGE